MRTGIPAGGAPTAAAFGPTPDQVIVTTTTGVAALVRLLNEHHSHDVPEIIATPIEGGSTHYLASLVSETRGTSPGDR